ncbi:MAG TPA: DNA repair protein RecO, partial [Bacteroidota bacterium]|nr:DNA repair protein RecO [Bacteroidota bacterium]
MSQIVTTEAIVLKSMKYRETSRIVTFYTRSFGKIPGIVKGARQAKSKYGTSLQPMSYVSLVFYRKEGREIQTVSQCDLMKSFRHLAEDMEKMAVGMAMIEL